MYVTAHGNEAVAYSKSLNPDLKFYKFIYLFVGEFNGILFN